MGSIIQACPAYLPATSEDGEGTVLFNRVSASQAKSELLGFSRITALLHTTAKNPRLQSGELRRDR